MDHDQMRRRVLGGLGACGLSVAAVLGGWALLVQSQELTVRAPIREIALRVYACPAQTPPPDASCKPTYGTPELPTAYACPSTVRLTESACQLQPVLDPIEGSGAGALDGNGGVLGVDCPGDDRCPITEP